jgi:GDPmannose 4,6-dehydratase
LTTAFWEVANYREAYNLFAYSGILFNHEFPLRPERFVTPKIVLIACRIPRRSPEKLQVGDISVQRDWGWGPEYVEAIYLMLQQSKPDDYVIATMESHALKEFVVQPFATLLGLDWEEHTVIDTSLLYRSTEIALGKGNPAKAKEKLGGPTKYKMPHVVKMMVEAS